MKNSAAYILALRDTPGAGVVSAGRLAEHFKTPEELAACPLEQVILRLKRVPNAEALAARLRSEVHDRFQARLREFEALRSHGVEAISFLDDLWPDGLQDLSRSDRPLVLFCYGSRAGLSLKRVSFFASPPLEDQAFELSQLAIRHVLSASAAVVCGATSGFDVVAAKIGSSIDAAGPVIMVASAGLRKMERTVRPAATAAVRNGGLLASPFEMDHGPYPHDEHALALVKAAMSHANVFISPREDTAEHRAMAWSIANGRPTFHIGGTSLAPSTHLLIEETDLDWLVVAVGESEASTGETTMAADAKPPAVADAGRG